MSVSHDQDRFLARRMSNGDERAFEEFFGRYFTTLYRFALPRVGRDPDEAEDVAQATLCTAISRIGNYRGEAALLTWLCTFCRYEISARNRRRRREPQRVDHEQDDDISPDDLDRLLCRADPRTARDVGLEIGLQVRSVLERLPASYAEALEWKYVEGISVREIGIRQGIGEKAAESLLTRARNAFRTLFRSGTESAE